MTRPGKEMIEIDIQRNVAVLTLNDPPANRLTFNMFSELSNHLKRILGPGSIRGVIITGAGRHFSSGSDPAELQAEAEFHTCQEHRSILEAIHQSKIPVISAINGVCLGSACELALACHFRLATPNAVLGLPETTFSLMPGLGGMNHLASLTGLAKGLELILSGETYSANTAIDLGIIDSISEKSQIISTAVDFISKVNFPFQVEFRKIYIEKYLKT